MRLLLLAFVLFSLAACDSNGSGLVARGQFEASLTGATTLELAGSARIMRQTNPDGSVFVGLTMVPSGFPTRSLSLSGEDEDALSRTGTFTLGGARGLGLVYIDVLGTESGLVATAGSVTLTRADDDRVIGTFEATLEPLSGGATTQAEGAFDATRGLTVEL